MRRSDGPTLCLMQHGAFEPWARRQGSRNFDNDGYGFDYVLVFRPRADAVVTPATSCGDALTGRALQLLEDMVAFELELKVFWSSSRELVYIKVRAPLHVIERVADLIDLPMEADPVKLKQRAKNGVQRADGSWKVVKIDLNGDRKLCKHDPYEFIYGVFDTDEDRKCIFKKKLRAPAGCRDHPFTCALRLRILHEIFTNRKLLARNFDLLERETAEDGHRLLAHFALHTTFQVKLLLRVWIVWCKWPWSPEPLEDVKEYFGEQIAMYFTFLNHYLVWLTPPAVLGLGVQIHVLSTLDTQAGAVPPFLLFLSVWSVAMLEFWKRKEADVAMRWGTLRVTRERPEFIGEVIRSPVTGEEMVYYPSSRKCSRLIRSMIVVGTVIVLVVAIVAAIFFFRYAMLVSGNTLQAQTAPLAASFVNAVVIQILNYFYAELADWLTYEENHRTFDGFDDALIVKLFAFQFVNSYASFFYIAFGQRSIEGSCGTTTCMDALAINMATIFIVALTVGNILEIVVPLVRSHRRVKDLMRRMEACGASRISVAEFQAQQEPYEASGTLDDYLELAIQFGYVTLFAAALPAAPLLAWVNNYFEYRFDALKLLKVLQRPMPRPVASIGSWLVIFQTLSILAVATNAALMCFTFDEVWDVAWSAEGRLWTFILWQYFLFTCMYVLELAVPDMSEDTDIQMQRQAFLSHRVINGEEDDEDDFESARKLTPALARAAMTATVNQEDAEDGDQLDLEGMHELLPLGSSQSGQGRPPRRRFWSRRPLR